MAEQELPPTQRRHSKPGAKSPGFGADSFGMRVAPVEHVVKAKQRSLEQDGPSKAAIAYESLSRHIRIINRGMKGPGKNKGFMGVVNGEIWPDGAEPEDEASWLQPGEYMDVPKDVALHLVGNVWDPTLPSRMDIVQRYGGPDYERPSGDKTDPRNTPMTAVAAAPVPDLIVVEISRNKPQSDYKAIFDLYQPEWAKKELVTA